MDFNTDEEYSNEDEARGVFAIARPDDEDNWHTSAHRSGNIDDVPRLEEGSRRHSTRKGATSTLHDIESGRHQAHHTTTEITHLLAHMATTQERESSDSDTKLSACLKTTSNILTPFLPFITLIATGTASIVALTTDYSSVTVTSISILNIILGITAVTLTLTYGVSKQNQQETDARNKQKNICSNLRAQVSTYQEIEQLCSRPEESDEEKASTAVAQLNENIEQYYQSKLGKRYIWVTGIFAVASLPHPGLAIAALTTSTVSPTSSLILNLAGAAFGTFTLILYSSFYRNWESRKIRIKNSSLDDLRKIITTHTKDCIVALLLASCHSSTLRDFRKRFSGAATDCLLEKISDQNIKSSFKSTREQVIRLAEAIYDDARGSALRIQALLCSMMTNCATMLNTMESLEVNMTGHTTIISRPQKNALDTLATAVRAKNDKGELFGTEAGEVEQIKGVSQAVDARLGRIETQLKAQAAEIQAQREEHTIEIQTLREEHAIEIQTLREEHAIEIQTLREEHATEIQSVKSMMNMLAQKFVEKFGEEVGNIEAVCAISEAEQSEPPAARPTETESASTYGPLTSSQLSNDEGEASTASSREQRNYKP